MTAPLNFPVEYGKIGKWPGGVNPLQAQAIYSYAIQCQKGARFVELGFDGGRTTIVLSWAARELGASINVDGVMPGPPMFWFQRVERVFKVAAINAHEKLPAIPADLLVVNPTVPMSAIGEWLKMLPPSGILVMIGKTDAPVGDFVQLAVAPGQIGVWQKTGTANVIDRAIGNVVNELSGNGTEGGALDKNRSAKIYGLRGGKERNRGGNSADTVLDAPVVANESN